MTAQPRSEFGLYKKFLMAVIDQMPPPEAFDREILKKLLRKQAAIQRGLAPLAKGRFDGFIATIQPNLQNDRRQDGWTLIDHTPRSITAVSDLKLVPFLRDGEKTLRGYDMMGRARWEFGADLGQEDAEFLLEHKDEIPEELRQFYLVFSRTVWQDSGGYLYVSCLIFGAERWCLYFGWLGDGFYPRDRLARFRK